ncbi:hypothetical protein RhiirA4_478573 [Rhizophagus irregularis]|uniref:BED-type domain-containing protein n=1 Tax=Rhizophagus irregularis TaxID=588596 RepID=A0A2I1HF44_9GLOM|nr:hypothetical protein RhiirA4_478573 [Rhizophagus irregularis]
MTDSISSNSKKTKAANYGGRPKKPIWRFFEQVDKIDKGHYVATCLACGQIFRPGKITTMEKHIVSSCLKVDCSIREAVIYMVEAREQNSDLSKERKEDINTALIKAFVCCDLPWHLVEHLFIIELFKQLRSNYSLSDRKTLADNMLTQEILRVNVKVYRLLEGETLDGWTSPSGKSLWNFVIHFSNGWDILWKISDFSGESHTAEFLAQQIQLILEEIGIQKFAGIVTDAGSNHTH